MNDAPKKIYLQHDPESTGEPFNEADEITWCVDKINDTDIEYFRADLLTDRLKAALMKYGAHVAPCSLYPKFAPSGTWKCTCGLFEALGKPND